MTAALGAQDLARGFARISLSFDLASADLRGRYARSFIGPFWMSLTMLGTTIAISFVVVGLFGGELKKTVPFVMLGIIIYSFIVAVINESTLAFVASKSHLLGAPIPYSTIVFSVVLRNMIAAMHHLFAYFAVAIAIGVYPQVTWLWSLLGSLLVILSVTGIAFFLASICPRYRDVAPFVSVATGIGALLSPVYWRPETLVKNQFIATYNPVRYLLDVVRLPFMNEPLATEQWVVAGLIATFSLTLGLWSFFVARKRLPFWI